jgi:hypothetical protein
MCPLQCGKLCASPKLCLLRNYERVKIKIINSWLNMGQNLKLLGVNNLQAIHNVMVKCKNLMGQRDVALPVMSEVYTVPAATS